MAQDAVPQVRDATERIFQAVGERVVVEGVDGEVAAFRRLADGEVRVGVDKEAPVADAAFRLAARKGDVDVEVLELENAK